MTQKPNLNYRQIWNINFGFMGLQVCLSLMIANMSRIFSGMGADIDELASLWLVAPLSGLILPPIIGYWSDKTWTPYGRRIPFISVGIIFTALLMVLIPNSLIISEYISPVFVSVAFIFLVFCALNIAMQPYRSLVGDMVNKKQTNLGFSVQTLLTNIGGILGSTLPFVLTIWGVSNQSEEKGFVVSSVASSFYIGAGILLLTNLWTCFTVKEYPPVQFEKSDNSDLIISQTNKIEKKKLRSIILQLSITQLFSWFAFYYLWVYATDAIAYVIWNTNDPLSVNYNHAANWFGVLTAIYSIISAVFSLFIPKIADKINRKVLYALALALGGLSLLSIYYIDNQYLLILPMVGIGIAWAMILTVPFAILSSIVPPNRMGLFMGLFNITIVVPQIVGGLLGGFIFKSIVGGSAIGMILIAGMSLLLGAISVVFINDKRE